jgi:hypothetical protein
MRPLYMTACEQKVSKLLCATRCQLSPANMLQCGAASGAGVVHTMSFTPATSFGKFAHVHSSFLRLAQNKKRARIPVISHSTALLTHHAPLYTPHFLFACNRAIVASAAAPAAAQAPAAAAAAAAATSAVTAETPAVRSPSGFVENVLEVC